MRWCPASRIPGRPLSLRSPPSARARLALVFLALVMEWGVTTLAASFAAPLPMHTASEKRSVNAHSLGARMNHAAHAFESRGADLGERVSSFLRAKHPAKTAINVSADTGGRVPVNTIKTWLQRGSAPDAEGYTELWLAYGVEFLAALADRRAPEWLVEARRNYEAMTLKAEIAALERKLAGVK